MPCKQRITRNTIVKPLLLAVAATFIPAMALAATAPAAGSLPGSFSSSVASTYTSSSSANGNIAYSASGPVVLQWGGAVDTPSVNAVAAPSGVTANSGLDIGSGASLTIQNTDNAASSVLLSDITGNPSQVDGTLTAEGAASGDPAPTVFVANANGIVVGNSGSIVAPSGFGMAGYAQDPAAFVSASGDLTVNSATSSNDGTVSVVPGANLSGVGDFMLVTGGGDVNVGEATPTVAPLTVVDGLGYTETPAGTFTPNTSLPTQNNASANLVIDGGTVASPINLALGASSGNFTVDSGANLYLPNGLKAVGGINANNGNITMGSAQSLAGNDGVTNTGTLTFAAAGTEGFYTASGDITNTGIINFSQSTGNNFLVTDLDGTVNLGGMIEQDGAALSASNPLSGIEMGVQNGSNTSGNSGVLNISTSLFSSNNLVPASGVFGDVLSGYVIRFLPGGSYKNTASNGVLDLGMGGGKLGGYAYNLSLFPGTSVSATNLNIAGFDTNNGAKSDINLDGTMTGTNINATAGTINSGANGANGGFAVNQGGSLNVTFSGDLNNPEGAAVNGQPSQYLYNGLSVNMLGTGGTINLAPVNTSAAPQMVNLLVNGNATLATSGLSNPLSAGSTIAPSSSYPNSHYLVEDNGNMTLSSGFYWPGLTMFRNVSSLTNPMTIGTGTITLTGPVSNVIPSDVSGGAGIFFMTDNPLVGVSSTNTVTTNTNSWINFPSSSGLAQAYGSLNPGFYGATVVSGGNLGTSSLSSGSINAAANG